MNCLFPSGKKLVMLLGGVALFAGAAVAARGFDLIDHQEGLAKPYSGDLIAESIYVDGKKRSYLLFHPSSEQRVPLVMAFHPLGGTSEQMARLTKLHALGEEGRFAVVYPQADDRMAWQSGVSSHMTFVAALIDHLVSSYRVDPTRVYATGMSSGGLFSLDLACERPELFVALAPVVANFLKYSVRYCQPDQAVPMLFVHGTEDVLIPFDGGWGVANFLSATETVEFWAENNGCTSAPIVTDHPDLDPDDGTTVEERDYGCDVMHYVVIGGGHTWPGMPGGTDLPILGRISQDVSASELIAEFFDLR